MNIESLTRNGSIPHTNKHVIRKQKERIMINDNIRT